MSEIDANETIENDDNDSKDLVDDADQLLEELEADDPYAYLQRPHFTSEKFKIELRNLPRRWGVKELKKLLNNKLKLDSTKIKIPSLNSPWIYVTFKSEEDRKKAIEVLNNYSWRNCPLKADFADPIPDPLVKKRNQSAIDDDELSSKKPKLDNSNLSDRMKDVTTPLWRLTYEQQLKKKTKLVNSILKSYAAKILLGNKRLGKWLQQQQAKYNGLPCELYPLRTGSVTRGYRNKCEFTVGKNEETGEKTVGFRLSSYVKGSISVAPIEEALNVPEEMKTAVLAFQKLVRNSEHDVFNPENYSGFWRQLTVRYGFRTGQLMLMVGVYAQNMAILKLNAVKDQLKEYFTEGEGKCCKVTSLYLQHMRRRTDDTDFEYLWGDTFITEQVLGKTFRISPQAFFQVNTNAAEILYEAIDELTGLNRNVTLLDICCGTGSIGICLAHKCGEVLGIELSQEAIADAHENMRYNRVNNAKFFAGKGEEVISCVAYKSTRPEVVAVLDPPRAGIRHAALVHLRKCKKIKKLIYVSCNPRGAIKNFVNLSRPTSKVYHGEPFLPVKAIPVDIFPYTNHCELVIYFERQ